MSKEHTIKVTASSKVPRVDHFLGVSHPTQQQRETKAWEIAGHIERFEIINGRAVCVRDVYGRPYAR